MLSRNLEQTLHKALSEATKRAHEYATLEHLLLALAYDQDAMAVLRSCGVSLDKTKEALEKYLENDLAYLKTETAEETNDSVSTRFTTCGDSRAIIRSGRSNGRECPCGIVF